MALHDPASLAQLFVIGKSYSSNAIMPFHSGNREKMICQRVDPAHAHANLKKNFFAVSLELSA
jgi:hypothetical protein